MNMYVRNAGGAIVALVALVFVVCPSAIAAVTDPLDSSGFTYQYEFDVLPSEADLDSNGVYDFTLDGEVTGTLANGVWSMNSTAAQRSYFLSSESNQIWAQSGITYATGYTIETRVKLNSVDPSAPFGTTFVQLSPGDDDTATGWLNLSPEGQSWGYATTPTPGINDDDYHVFRIAQEPGATSYSVWRDDVLISSDFGSAYAYALNHLTFGDKSGAWGGSADYDYLRFTSGAYAPVNQVVPGPPTTQKDSADFTYKYEMDLDPTDPSAINLDGNVDEFSNPLADWSTIGTGIISLTGNGTLQIDSNGESQAYLESGISESTHVWPTTGFEVLNGFTIELSVKVIADEEDHKAMGMVICPADSEEMPVLEIATDGQSKRNDASFGDEGATYNNTDDFHEFRIVRNSQADGGKWFVWRDGELLTPDGYWPSTTYERNSLSLGDVGGVYGGVVEIDYLRFMEGAFAPEEGTAPIAGDANNDGKVDGSDVTILAGNWQAGVGDPNPETVTWEMGDFNGDGQVDGSDVTILAGNWQAGVTAAAASVPEPSTILLVLSGVAGLVLIRRRK